MAVDKKKAEEEIIKIIQDNGVLKISHIFNYYKKITRATFYNWGFDKLDSIKEGIEGNQESAKQIMIHKWISSDNATLQIAAFRLLADKEEHQKLNQSYIDHSNKDGTLRQVEVTIVKDGSDKA